MTDAELDTMIADLRSPDTELFDVADAIAALRHEGQDMTPNYDDLCKRLRDFGSRYVSDIGLPFIEAADAIAALRAERDALRALLVEWDDGMYDGLDFLRRVQLALHGDKGLTDAALAGKEKP